jgi:hypothetical protein
MHPSFLSLTGKKIFATAGFFVFSMFVVLIMIASMGGFGHGLGAIGSIILWVFEFSLFSLNLILLWTGNYYCNSLYGYRGDGVDRNDLLFACVKNFSYESAGSIILGIILQLVWSYLMVCLLFWLWGKRKKSAR